jgi:hypothetical protein
LAIKIAASFATKKMDFISKSEKMDLTEPIFVVVLLADYCARDMFFLSRSFITEVALECPKSYNTAAHYRTYNYVLPSNASSSRNERIMYNTPNGNTRTYRTAHQVHHFSSNSTSITSGPEFLERPAPPEDPLFGCHTMFWQFMHLMTWLR